MCFVERRIDNEIAVVLIAQSTQLGARSQQFSHWLTVTTGPAFALPILSWATMQPGIRSKLSKTGQCKHVSSDHLDV